MIERGATYVVMGLLNTDSIAYSIGTVIESMGGRVIYTVQNERMKQIFLDRDENLPEEPLDVRPCDVTVEDEVRELFAGAVAFLLGPWAAKITGQVLFVDGGASIVGGRLLPGERPPRAPDA